MVFNKIELLDNSIMELRCWLCVSRGYQLEAAIDLYLVDQVATPGKEKPLLTIAECE